VLVAEELHLMSLLGMFLLSFFMSVLVVVLEMVVWNGEREMGWYL
jgi:hypothetical protein